MRCAACDENWGPWGLYFGRMYCAQCLESDRAIDHAARCARLEVHFESGRRLELPLSLRRPIYPRHIGCWTARRELPLVALRGERCRVTWSGLGVLDVTAWITHGGKRRRRFGGTPGKRELRLPASNGTLRLSVIQRGIG